MRTLVVAPDKHGVPKIQDPGSIITVEQEGTYLLLSQREIERQRPDLLGDDEIDLDDTSVIELDDFRSRFKQGLYAVHVQGQGVAEDIADQLREEGLTCETIGSTHLEDLLEREGTPGVVDYVTLQAQVKSHPKTKFLRRANGKATDEFLDKIDRFDPSLTYILLFKREVERGRGHLQTVHGARKDYEDRLVVLRPNNVDLEDLTQPGDIHDPTEDFVIYALGFEPLAKPQVSKKPLGAILWSAFTSLFVGPSPPKETQEDYVNVDDPMVHYEAFVAKELARGGRLTVCIASGHELRNRLEDPKKGGLYFGLMERIVTFYERRGLEPTRTIQDIKSGQYKGSVYIPTHRKRHMTF